MRRWLRPEGRARKTTELLATYFLRSRPTWSRTYRSASRSVGSISGVSGFAARAACPLDGMLASNGVPSNKARDILVVDRGKRWNVRKAEDFSRDVFCLGRDKILNTSPPISIGPWHGSRRAIVKGPTPQSNQAILKPAAPKIPLDWRERLARSVYLHADYITGVFYLGESSFWDQRLVALTSHTATQSQHYNFEHIGSLKKERPSPGDRSLGHFRRVTAPALYDRLICISVPFGTVSSECTPYTGVGLQAVWQISDFVMGRCLAGSPFLFKTAERSYSEICPQWPLVIWLTTLSPI